MSVKTGRGGGASVLAALVIACGCSPVAVHHLPVERPPEATVPGLTVRVTEIVVDHGELRVIAEVDAASAVALKAIELEAAVGGACVGGGLEPARVTVDGGAPIWDRSISIRRRARLELVFPLGGLNGPGPLQKPLNLALGFVSASGQDGCVSVALTSSQPGPTWRRARRAIVAWDIWMLPPFALLGSYGSRYGPAQLSLGAGAASIYCRCPEGQGTLQLPVSAALELLGGRAGRSRVYGLKLAYDLVPVVGVGAAEWALRHGGHVELKVGIATGMGRHGLPAGAEAGVWTIGAVAAYWPTIHGEAPMRFLGLTVGWQFPL